MSNFSEHAHLSVVERYYSKKYRTDINGIPGQDQCILLHCNKVCVITVAKSHPVITEAKKIVSVNFQTEDGVDRMDNKVTGKGKKGAQRMKADSELCSISCEDGSKYKLVSCVRGLLLEVNENLIENPHLLTEKCYAEGYLAIILPPLKEYPAIVSKLESEESYLEKLQQRKEKTVPENSPG